jgi:hypothetical protein
MAASRPDVVGGLLLHAREWQPFGEGARNIVLRYRGEQPSLVRNNAACQRVLCTAPSPRRAFFPGRLRAPSAQSGRHDAGGGQRRAGC